MTNSLILNHFGFLELSGKDSKKFLQGYTTCNLETLTPEKAQIGAICDIQGRVITSFLLLEIKGKLILRMSKDLVEKTLRFLSKYIVFSKAEVKDISNELFCHGIDVAKSSFMHVKLVESGFEIDLGNRKELWLNEKQSNEEMCLKDWTDLEIDLSHSWIALKIVKCFRPNRLTTMKLMRWILRKGVI